MNFALSIDKVWRAILFDEDGKMMTGVYWFVIFLTIWGIWLWVR